MNERNYRKYSQEFKLEALELLRRGDKSAGLICRAGDCFAALSMTTALYLKALFVKFAHSLYSQ
jgi:hypothetical protein